MTITAVEVLVHLRGAAIEYGEARLGFSASRIGTHSLAGVPVETIQLIGRWRSQRFMRYIRIQVQQMTKGVADAMTANNDFFTVEGRKREPTFERSTRFTEGRPGPRLPSGQLESCGLHHKPGRRESELENWRPGIEGERSDLGPKSDAKQLGATLGND